MPLEPSTSSRSNSSVDSPTIPSALNGLNPHRHQGHSLKNHRSFSLQTANNLISSFRYAGSGIAYAFGTQRNFRIHTALGSFAILLGVILHLSPVEIAVISLTIGIVLAMELLNTALEAVVDLTVKQTYHDLAKIAKDCAAAAVLISAIAAMGIAGCLIVPKLLSYLG